MCVIPISVLVRVATLLALPGSAACDDANPIDYDKPRGLETVELTFSSSNLVGDNVEDTTPVLSARFLEDIHRELGPVFSGIELKKLVITFDPPVAGLAGWSDLFQGELHVYFDTDSGDNFLVSTTTAPSGFDALPLPIEVSNDELSASADMLSGHFSVRLQATSGMGPQDQFALALTVNMTFDAY